MTIIEWPVIEVWELSEFKVQQRKQEMDVYDVEPDVQAPPAKRAKVASVQAVQKPASVSLVNADYGTDSDEEEVAVSQLLMAA